MRLVMGDLKEQDLRALIQAISNICYSEEFSALKQELECLYNAAGVENPSVSAFQDTLYALLCQNKEEDMEENGDHIKNYAH